MKRLILAALLGTAIVLPSYAASAESSKHPKSYVCHYQFDDLDNDNVVDAGEAKWKLLSLGNGAAAKHLLHHPDDFTAVADTDCNAAV